MRKIEKVAHTPAAGNRFCSSDEGKRRDGSPDGNNSNLIDRWLQRVNVLGSGSLSLSFLHTQDACQKLVLCMFLSELTAHRSPRPKGPLMQAHLWASGAFGRRVGKAFEKGRDISLCFAFFLWLPYQLPLVNRKRS